MVIRQNQPYEQEQKFIKHMTKHPWWQYDIDNIRNSERKLVIGTDDILRHYGQRLICPKCERGAYRHKKKDMARCLHCGWEGQSVTVDEYITGKLYR